MLSAPGQSYPFSAGQVREEQNAPIANRTRGGGAKRSAASIRMDLFPAFNAAKNDEPATYETVLKKMTEMTENMTGVFMSIDKFNARGARAGCDHAPHGAITAKK